VGLNSSVPQGKFLDRILNYPTTLPFHITVHYSLSFHQSKLRTMTQSVVKIVLAKINTFGHIHLLFRKRTNDSMSANTALNFHKNSLWQSLLFPRTKCLFSSRHEISSRRGHTLKRCHIQEHLALKTQCIMEPASKQTPHPHHTGLLCLNTC